MGGGRQRSVQGLVGAGKGGARRMGLHGAQTAWGRMGSHACTTMHAASPCPRRLTCRRSPCRISIASRTEPCRPDASSNVRKDRAERAEPSKELPAAARALLACRLRMEDAWPPWEEARLCVPRPEPAPRPEPVPAATRLRPERDQGSSEARSGRGEPRPARRTSSLPTALPAPPGRSAALFLLRQCSWPTKLALGWGCCCCRDTVSTGEPLPPVTPSLSMSLQSCDSRGWRSSRPALSCS